MEMGPLHVISHLIPQSSPESLCCPFKVGHFSEYNPIAQHNLQPRARPASFLLGRSLTWGVGTGSGSVSLTASHASLAEKCISVEQQQPTHHFLAPKTFTLVTINPIPRHLLTLLFSF